MVESSDDRDLAVRFAYLVKEPIQDFHDSFVSSSDKKQIDPTLTSFGSINQASLKEFKKLRLEPHTKEITELYLNAAPGADLNLSQDEIDVFAALKASGKTSTKDVEECLYNVLRNRYMSYRRKGLDGILPYARAKNKSFEPSRALRHKTELAKLLKTNAPSFYRGLLDYPKNKPKSLEEQFSWNNFCIDNLPTISLIHRMCVLEKDSFVFSERQFYVSRSHNSVQSIGGAFPVQEGTIVLYLMRTGTDQVAGFGGSTKRSVGQRVMGGRVAANLERFCKIEAKKMMR